MNNLAMRWLAASTIWWGAACHAEPAGCLIEPDRVADVGSQAVGVLAQIKVERGDTVVTGQLLARTRDLLEQDFVSGQAEAEARVAEQRVTQSKEAQQVALREYQLSAVQLGERDARAPFDGIVLKRYRTEGERIEREPVVRVARVDPLRVEAIVPAKLYNTIQVGQLAIVKTDLTLFPSLSAKVVLVDRVIDPASNSFRVRLALPNPNKRIPAGLRCRVNFVGSSADAASTTAPAPAPASTPDPQGPARLRAGMAAAALALPGGRLAEPAKQHEQLDRHGAKNYLHWRRARLSMSKDLALPGAAMPALARSPEPLPAKLIVALR